MCQYCEKEKWIEEFKNDIIRLSIYGRHLRIVGKIVPRMHITFGRSILINYCPMCGRKLGE